MVKPREPTAIDLESESLLDPADVPDSNGPPSVSGGGLRARHKAVGSSPGSTVGLLPEAPPLSDTVEAFKAEEEHRLPITEGDFPLRALAQGLAMLSIDDISRLRLPALPWQTGEDGHPSFLQSLRRKPFKAHYTSLVGFVISTGARACWVHFVLLRKTASLLQVGPLCPSTPWLTRPAPVFGRRVSVYQAR